MKGSYILYVEDDEIEVMKFQHTMNKFLKEGTIKVAENGEVGLAVLDENRANLPKLIVLDINMPKMNGFELLKRIKNDHDFKRVPCVMLTTSNQKSDIDKSFNLSAAGYFVKPFETAEYNIVIENIYRYWNLSQTLN